VGVNIKQVQIMKKVNRFAGMLWVFGIIMVSCIFRNMYQNAVIILFSVFALMLGFAAIEKKMNEKEKRFFNKLDSLL
jgi:general stress protein CsbA